MGTVFWALSWTVKEQKKKTLYITRNLKQGLYPQKTLNFNLLKANKTGLQPVSKPAKQPFLDVIKLLD